ncbi:MAG: 16S rRNA (adenine(1518)-N(6)/adenine(1519)-N(6))-dimethyltransferase RsmA [Actinomycetota bacterium]|nr:16S rRNA (adenine(1518)-N(6)/adenine(1519)-N(6))-dimethyltransferase RsmA [Actinomycetota bacterium]
MNNATRLLGAARLRDLLDRHGIRPARSLGQNFVIDPNTIRKVVAAARLSADDRVLEIGAGVGSLTLALASECRKVVAVEKDSRLVTALEEVLAGKTNAEIVAADAMTLDFSDLDVNKLVANLPYNVAASIVLKTFEQAPAIEQLTVMTQKEVGERLLSAPGSRIYGQTSVLLAYFAEGELAGRISRRAFYPVPRVDSVVVRLSRRRTLPDVEWRPFSALVKAAFSQRRKTLRNSLSSAVGAARAEELLIGAGLDPNVRAEAVDLNGYVRIAALTRREETMR